jgi:penicillin-binding protein 2
MRLDIDIIANYARKFGLGSATRIDLPNEVKGLVPDREWKLRATGDKWYPGETISVAIGQGPMLVTALQQASLMASVSSDGILIQPHLLSAKLDLKGNVVEKSRLNKQKITGIDFDYFEAVKRALWGVVNERGTGGKARLPGYDVCGKTGTVQIVGYDRGGDLSKREKERFGDHAWFVAFAPYSDPQIALAVFVEHGGHGSEAAAPVAAKILEGYFKSNKISPYPPPEFAARKGVSSGDRPLAQMRSPSREALP